MKIATEIIGLFIISLIMIAVPILCSLSFVYNWHAFFKLILVVACFIEWACVIDLLADVMDKKD